MNIKRNNFFYLLTTILFLIINNNSFAQNNNEKWVPVKYETGSSLYINTSGLSSFGGDDIYVWILEENNPPAEIEMIEKKIYKTKSYLLINKKLYRYSTLQMIFYDDNDNVIKSYNYERNMENADFRYSSPILENSNIEAVLNKCMEYFQTVNEQN